jgi:dihydroorotase
MVHVGDKETPLEELTSLLRPGDIVTHAFRQFGGLVGDDRKVSDGVREARNRGVLFDVGHGAGSFNFDAADHALAEGFPPDTISSDVSSISVEGPVFDLVTTMSKFIYLGLPIYEVIKLSTMAPAKVMGLENIIGTLRIGSIGDVAVLRLDEGSFKFTDAQGVTVESNQKLNHVQTVKNGRVYRPWLK